MDHDSMMRTGVALVQTMMRSASIEKIRPIDWWTRARTALEGAARSSDHFSAMASAMARKLQIDVARTDTATDLAFLADEVAGSFPAFRRFVEREALYIVAMAQADSKARKEERAAKHARGDGGVHPSGIDTIQDSYDLAAEMAADLNHGKD